MKYVRYEIEGFFLFPDSIKHSIMKDLIEEEGLLSAGFVEFVEGVPFCYGESASLNLGTGIGDTDALTDIMKIKQEIKDTSEKELFDILKYLNVRREVLNGRIVKSKKEGNKIETIYELSGLIEIEAFCMWVKKVLL